MEKTKTRTLSKTAKRNRYSNGTSAVRVGRNTYLYRTPEGDFYLVRQSCCQGEQNRIGPLSLDEAIGLFKSLNQEYGGFEEIFPGVVMWK